MHSPTITGLEWECWPKPWVKRPYGSWRFTLDGVKSVCECQRVAVDAESETWSFKSDDPLRGSVAFSVRLPMRERRIDVCKLPELIASLDGWANTLLAVLVFAIVTVQ